MIEKLELPSSARLVCGKDYDLAFKYIKQTVNQLVDAVNELQKDYDNVCVWVGEQKLKTPVENVQDKFAEQRKWIGKICVFWDNDDTQEFSYGVLTKIDTESGFGVQYCCNDEYDFDDCEPVKPDEDIIF